METIPGLTVTARVDAGITGARVYDLDSRPVPADIRVENGRLTATMDLPLYALIELTK